MKAKQMSNISFLQVFIITTAPLKHIYFMLFYLLRWRQMINSGGDVIIYVC